MCRVSVIIISLYALLMYNQSGGDIYVPEIITGNSSCEDLIIITVCHNYVLIIYSS